MSSTRSSFFSDISPSCPSEANFALYVGTSGSAGGGGAGGAGALEGGGGGGGGAGTEDEPAETGAFTTGLAFGFTCAIGWLEGAGGAGGGIGAGGAVVVVLFPGRACAAGLDFTVV